MRTIAIKAVIITDGADYVIHGASSKGIAETPDVMFKAITGGSNPIWHFDPSKEIAHYIELEVSLPEFEDTFKDATL